MSEKDFPVRSHPCSRTEGETYSKSVLQRRIREITKEWRGGVVTEEEKL